MIYIKKVSKGPHMVRLKSRIRAHHLEERKAVSDLPLPRRPTDESTVRGLGGVS